VARFLRQAGLQGYHRRNGPGTSRRRPATLRRSALVTVDLSSPSLPGQAWGDVLFGERAYRGAPEDLAGILRAYAAAGFGEVQVWLNPCSIAGMEAFAPVLELLREG